MGETVPDHQGHWDAPMMLCHSIKASRPSFSEIYQIDRNATRSVEKLLVPFRARSTELCPAFGRRASPAMDVFFNSSETRQFASRCFKSWRDRRPSPVMVLAEEEVCNRVREILENEFLKSSSDDDDHVQVQVNAGDFFKKRVDQDRTDGCPDNDEVVKLARLRVTKKLSCAHECYQISACLASNSRSTRSIRVSFVANIAPRNEPCADVAEETGQWSAIEGCRVWLAIGGGWDPGRCCTPVGTWWPCTFLFLWYVLL